MNDNTTQSRLIRLETKLEFIIAKLDEQNEQLKALNVSLPRLHNDISIIGADVSVLKLKVSEIEKEVDKHSEFQQNYSTERATNDRWIKFLGIGSLGGIFGLILSALALVRDFMK